MRLLLVLFVATLVNVTIAPAPPVGVLSAIGLAQQLRQLPDEITVDVEVISDSAPFRSWYVLNVKADQPKSHVTLIP
jgi:hypothetical protein